MRVIRHPRADGPGTAIAIGSFDGVHLGHQAILGLVKDAASARGLASAVLTFEPLPREFLAPANAPARLSSLPEKILALQALGIDLAFVQRFYARFAAREPADFARWLHGNLGARHVTIGADFRFGAHRAGNAQRLAELGAELGFEVEVLKAVKQAGERISSTRVRAALASGDLDEAARLLGRPYAICGRVQHGAKRGRELGFPTANIRLGRARPALGGVFAVKCTGAATRGLEGVASLGINPAVQTGGPATLEAFFFDFHGDLYGRRLTLEFHKKLRDEAHFASLDALVAQIRKDCDEAREYFGTRG
ncbi:bifunctional riboflavin kinase/FAD synthetase [Usitatibacter palustris]|uniref:Riboflavin biosynthesis protein n=1 Tax=Usitatibacter palustris TaxID=2732487 RepID=A0A6M4H9Y5_9PROT|nr:bifunctional riboflavin kinase/FAD synthetase [Usitatibacter palustris]QJR16410.1 Bifunctional riboflavin kinase/FMN adenylyltransferase [Usitatibacter palustris]